MELLTVKEVAERLKVSVKTVYQLCAQQRLAHLRLGVGRGTIRIHAEDLNDFIRGATVRPGPPAEPTPPRVKLKHLKV